MEQTSSDDKDLSFSPLFAYTSRMSHLQYCEDTDLVRQTVYGDLVKHIRAISAS